VAEAPLVYLIAGEPSGDRLGARLMAALSAELGGEVRFRGLGGEMMAARGLKSLFPISELAVMGIAEVLPKLRRILRRIAQVRADVLQARPAVLVTIDSPDFSLRVSKDLKGQGIPLIHYVAPSVWAWKAGRARKMARYLNRVLTLLPFEPPYFTREGLAADFVGHPVIESGADKGHGPQFRAAHKIAAADKLLCLLPGSRSGEIERHLPVMRGIAERVARPNLALVMPTVPHLEARLRAAVSTWPRVPIVVTGEPAKFDAFAASDAAVAASGTVSLELALARVPAVVIYRVNPLTAAVARRLVKVKYASIVNILLDEEVIPEFLQEDCNALQVAPAVERLLSDKGFADEQIARGTRALAMLAPPAQTPSQAAARVVARVLGKAAV
jgi:lipid-A-disaccharide synthase